LFPGFFMPLTTQPRTFRFGTVFSLFINGNSAFKHKQTNMKNIVLILLSITFACHAEAQQRQNQRMGAVYVTVNGNKNLQVAIDGNIYSLTSSSSTVSKIPVISNLEAGMHGLTVTGTANNNRRADNITTQFNLRRNFDMYINLNADGSLELIEKSKAASRNTPMTNTNFNTLMRNLRLQNTTQGRNAFLANTFNTANTYFTSIQVVQLLQQIRVESDRLPLAKLSFRTVTDPNSFSPVYGLFNVAANRTVLQAYVNAYDPDGDGVIDPPADNRNGMPAASFNNLYQTAMGQGSVNAQVNYIASAFNTTANYFTSSQAAQLIQLVNGESNRLQLAKLSYRAIVDPTNFSTVANLLYSQSSRDDLMNYVNTGQMGGGTNTRVAMSESDYTALTQAVSSQFLPYAKMTYLTNTFNNAAYYFTTAQAKNLIQMVTNESNRLQLSKAVYRNLVDRTNYTQFYDLFTLPASRTELNAYVQAYRD